MDLHGPLQIRLDGATRALLETVDDAASKVNDLRPLEPAVVARIHDSLLGERIFASNAIEGNTLNLRETVAILRTGRYDAGRRREAQEVLNLRAAIDYVQSQIATGVSPFDARPLLQAHTLLLADIQPVDAGVYRHEPVVLRGAKHQPPDASQVSDLVDQAFDLARQANDAAQIHPVVLAAWVHWALARVHPFVDGNGRTARLWQDWVLLEHRLTVAIIDKDRRSEYLDALSAADDGDFNELVQLIAGRVVQTFDHYLAETRADQQTADWAAALVGEVDVRLAERRRRDFLLWKRAMESFRFAMQRCVATINERGGPISIDMREYPTIEQETWAAIDSGLSASKTWFFALNFHGPRRSVWYAFFFGRHFIHEQDGADERAAPRVCLLASESVDRGDAVRLDDEASISPVRWREILVVNRGYVRRRFDAELGQEVYDRQISDTTIAQEFIADVVRAYLMS